MNFFALSRSESGQDHARARDRVVALCFNVSRQRSAKAERRALGCRKRRCSDEAYRLNNGAHGIRSNASTGRHPAGDDEEFSRRAPPLTVSARPNYMARTCWAAR